MNQVRNEKLHFPNAGKLPLLDKDKNMGDHHKVLKVKKEYKLIKEVIDDCLQDID